MLERCFSCFSWDQGQLMIAKRQHDFSTPFVTALRIEKCMKRYWYFQNLIQNQTHFLKNGQESPLIQYTGNVRLVGLRFILFGLVCLVLDGRTLVDIQYMESDDGMTTTPRP